MSSTPGTATCTPTFPTTAGISDQVRRVLLAGTTHHGGLRGTGRNPHRRTRRGPGKARPNVPRVPGRRPGHPRPTPPSPGPGPPHESRAKCCPCAVVGKCAHAPHTCRAWPNTRATGERTLGTPGRSLPSGNSPHIFSGGPGASPGRAAHSSRTKPVDPAHRRWVCFGATFGQGGEIDLCLSTSKLQGEILYDPAEGVLTAPAGTPLVRTGKTSELNKANT